LSGNTTSKSRDKGKGKAVAVNLELEVRGSRKRKSPMIFGHFSQPPKSVMKGYKCIKSARLAKLKFMESEDDEDSIVQVCGLAHFCHALNVTQPLLSGVPEVVLPQLSTIIVRMPQLPWSSGSPKKQSFGPASVSLIYLSGTHIYAHASTADCWQSSGGYSESFPYVQNSLLSFSLMPVALEISHQLSGGSSKSSQVVWNFWTC
jgi:hypothetical protein